MGKNFFWQGLPPLPSPLSARSSSSKANYTLHWLSHSLFFLLHEERESSSLLLTLKRMQTSLCYAPNLQEPPPPLQHTILLLKIRVARVTFFVKICQTHDYLQQFCYASNFEKDSTILPLRISFATNQVFFSWLHFLCCTRFCMPALNKPLQRNNFPNSKKNQKF